MGIDYGLKVSPTGSDINTVSDKDSIMTSKFSTLKIFTKGLTSVTTNSSGDATITITHNLGYPPAFLVFLKDWAYWHFLDNVAYPNAYIPLGGFNEWSEQKKTGNMHPYSTSTELKIVISGASASTTYYFKYIILIDLAGDFTGSDAYASVRDYGFKISKQGVDVKTAKAYELSQSSEFKSLQYYAESYKTQTLTLPRLFASPLDTWAEEGTYVDIIHGLGYPPLFMAYFSSPTAKISMRDVLFEIPYTSLNTNWAYYDMLVSSFCDSTRVRLSYWRASQYIDIISPEYEDWAEETIYLKCFIFTENLST